MQIMGVAWAAETPIEPPVHVPDPAVAWELPPFLAKHMTGWRS